VKVGTLAQPESTPRTPAGASSQQAETKDSEDVRVSGRPVGLWLLIAVLATEGLGLVGAALQLFVFAPDEWAAADTSCALGCLLVFKAYRLWSFHAGAWLMVMVASASAWQLRGPP
jgi:hypothetical protein